MPLALVALGFNVPITHNMNAMASIQPFNIAVPQAELEKLHSKLSNATFPDELDGAGWDYGAPLADVKRLTAYWKDSFDWKKQEEKLNELPNFRVAIPVEGFDTLDVHFVHQKSDVHGAIPLLYCHGCSFVLVSISLWSYNIDAT